MNDVESNLPYEYVGREYGMLPPPYHVVGPTRSEQERKERERHARRHGPSSATKFLWHIIILCICGCVLGPPTHNPLHKIIYYF